MKRAEELEPDLSADDIKVVELLEQSIEQAFSPPSTRTYLNFAKYRDPRVTRHHWDEFIRRADAAGWHVEIGRAHV